MALSDLKPYKVLYVHFGEDFTVIQLRTGDIEVVPFENEWFTPEILLTADTQGGEFWLIDRGGEDWTIVLYDQKENKLKVYDVDNWEFILNGLKNYEPEVIEL